MPLWLAIVVIVLVLGGVGVGIAAAAGAFEPKSGSYQVPTSNPSRQAGGAVRECSEDDQAKFVMVANEMMTNLEKILAQTAGLSQPGVNTQELLGKLTQEATQLMTTYREETPYPASRYDTCYPNNAANELNVKMDDLKSQWPLFATYLPTF